MHTFSEAAPTIGLRLSSRVQGLAKSRLAWLLLALASAGVASNLSAFEDDRDAPAKPAKAMKEMLMREGAKVESRRAKCRVAGERLVIEFDDGRTVDALANLASQRVFQACRDDATDSDWIVSGKFTEFQNLNYLLLENVVRAPAR